MAPNSSAPTRCPPVLPRRNTVITVGASCADVIGMTSRAIQIAIDAVAFSGGGTVRLASGDYILQDSIRLRPGVALVGAGPATILRRGPLLWGRLACDFDIAETHFTPVDPQPWQLGMGVCFRDNANSRHNGNLPYFITAVENGACLLERHMNEREDIWAAREAIAINHFPMLLLHQADEASIENLTVDAAVPDPDGVLNGLRCDAVYVKHSRNVTLRGLVVRNAHSDGICFADASTGMLLEDCDVGFSGNYGIHPGSHSADCLVQRCSIHDNGADGLYICWGIRRGRFLNNTIAHNGIAIYRNGICIGHKDTDCLIEGNRIVGNRKHGIAFRVKTEANGAHRAIIRNNIIEDNGSPADELLEIKSSIPEYESIGCGIHVEGVTRDIVIEGNTIRETRSGEARTQRHAVVLEKNATVASFRDNVCEGHPDMPVVDRNCKL